YIHTRLRYFMFLPWIFQRIERDRVAAGDFFRRLRHDEALLIDRLRHLGPGKGVIGYRAGRNLKRMPSDIYWGGLWDWGLRRLPLGLGEYAHRAAAMGSFAPVVDDDGKVTDRTGAMWAPLPDPPEGFLETDIAFELSREEAETLRDNVRHQQAGTLLAWLVAQPNLAAQCDYPWEAPSHGMPAELAEMVRHARCFSELTAGPQYVYNLLVARRAGRELGWDTTEVEEDQLGLIRHWVKMVESRHGELRSWADDLPAFWTLLYQHKYRIRRSTRDFVSGIVRSAIDNPKGFADDPAAHAEIRRRELQLKGKRARLAYRSALENWSGAAGGGQFGYRWSIAKRYLDELESALAGDR
ncbi:MAG: DUF6361 family protein, partial [bacterium]|nr:DUF6361 family protein [bacterium]